MGTWEASYDFAPHEPRLDELERRFAERTGVSLRTAQESNGWLALHASAVRQTVWVKPTACCLEVDGRTAVPGRFFADHLDAAIRDCGGRKISGSRFLPPFEARSWTQLRRWERVREQLYWLRALIPSRLTPRR